MKFWSTDGGQDGEHNGAGLGEIFNIFVMQGAAIFSLEEDGSTEFELIRVAQPWLQNDIHE